MLCDLNISPHKEQYEPSVLPSAVQVASAAGKIIILCTQAAAEVSDAVVSGTFVSACSVSGEDVSSEDVSGEGISSPVVSAEDVSTTSVSDGDVSSAEVSLGDASILEVLSAGVLSCPDVYVVSSVSGIFSDEQETNKISDKTSARKESMCFIFLSPFQNYTVNYIIVQIFTKVNCKLVQIFTNYNSKFVYLL